MDANKIQEADNKLVVAFAIRMRARKLARAVIANGIPNDHDITLAEAESLAYDATREPKRVR